MYVKICSPASLDTFWKRPLMASEMNNREGVIKFHLEFARKPCVTPKMAAEISAWRHIHYRLQLIGRAPERYEGYGFGNISSRCLSGHPGFFISGTQTGALARLNKNHFSRVSRCDPKSNTIVAEGMVEPSSEALTHGQIYQLDASVQCVIHAHSPDIWQAAGKIDLPSVGAEIGYGTPEMAEAVEKLFRATPVTRKKIFIMKGHEDGVVSFGRSLAEASQVMISTLADSLR